MRELLHKAVSKKGINAEKKAGFNSLNVETAYQKARCANSTDDLKTTTFNQRRRGTS